MAKQNEGMLGVMERKVLRKIHGLIIEVCRWGILVNAELRQFLDEEGIFNMY